MIRKILLDANLLIAAFDVNGNTTAEMKRKAIGQLSSLLADEQVKLFITPLVRYEVLRGIAWHSREDFLTMKMTLNDFPDLDITRDISELSADLFRFDKHKAELAGDRIRNLDKRKFDVFHFCSAHCNGLGFCSNDTDIAKIEKLHHEYVASLVA